MNNIKEEFKMDNNTVQQTSEMTNEVARATSGLSMKTKGIIVIVSVATLGAGVGIYFLVRHVKAKKNAKTKVADEQK